MKEDCNFQYLQLELDHVQWLCCIILHYCSLWHIHTKISGRLNQVLAAATENVNISWRSKGNPSTGLIIIQQEFSFNGSLFMFWTRSDLDNMDNLVCQLPANISIYREGPKPDNTTKICWCRSSNGCLEVAMKNAICYLLWWIFNYKNSLSK